MTRIARIGRIDCLAAGHQEKLNKFNGHNKNFEPNKVL